MRMIRKTVVACAAGVASLLGPRVIQAQDAKVSAEARVRSIVQKLEAMDSGADQWSIHEAIGDLVGLHDAAVPELTAVLESGRDKHWKLDPSTRSGRYYTRLRTVLMDTLRQMKSPAATAGLLKGVSRAPSLEDCADLVVLCGAYDDPELAKGISALVPGALRTIGEIGLEESHRRVPALAILLVGWIRRHSLSDSQEGIERILIRCRSEQDREGGWDSYQRFYDLLAEYSVERAVEVTCRLREGRPSDRFIAEMASGLGRSLPRARLARYYELLLERLSVSSLTRRYLYYGMPTSLFEADGKWTPKEAVEDATKLETFLEKRRATETETELKTALEYTLGSLRKSIEKAAKGTR